MTEKICSICNGEGVLVESHPDWPGESVTVCFDCGGHGVIYKCECGRWLYDLSGFTNGCECGRLYNSFGQRLSDPSGWGEETGEHPSDILRIP